MHFGIVELFSVALFPMEVTTKFPRVASPFSEIYITKDKSKRIYRIRNQWPCIL